MGFSISGANVNPNQDIGQQQAADLSKELSQANQELKDAIRSANQQIDTEVAGASKEQLTGKALDTTNALNPNLVQKNDKKAQHIPTEHDHNTESKEAAMLAALEQEKELEKKEKKHSPLSKSLDKMTRLEGQIDIAHADNEEEEAAISTFFDNLSRLRNLRQELKRLEYDEEHAIALLKEKKRLDEETRRQKLEAYKQEHAQSRSSDKTPSADILHTRSLHPTPKPEKPATQKHGHHLPRSADTNPDIRPDIRPDTSLSQGPPNPTTIQRLRQND